ncbi:tyrosine-type recombinase/integrase [Lysinibacillus sp. NPDC094177]|uniref:tyrosine-type recombinase/integrase n=1 Tax=Lysinibacillus sp. NPDC094177 TaxID=3390580 RepID=UPI003CFEE28C
MTVFDIEIDCFMLDCVAKGLAEKTMKSYEQTLKLYAKWMSDEFEIDSPTNVKAEHLRSYMRSLTERGKYEMTVNDKANNNPKAREDFGKKISNSTISNFIRNFKVFFSYLSQEQVIRTNPMKNVKHVKPVRKMKVMLEDNQLKQFFKSFDVTKFDQYRDWIVARLIFDTGSRIGELLDIVPSDIDLRANALLLRNTKNKKQRFVYFSAILIESAYNNNRSKLTEPFNEPVRVDRFWLGLVSMDFRKLTYFTKKVKIQQSLFTTFSLN